MSKAQNINTLFWRLLPLELVLAIVHYLSDSDKRRCMLVCTAWNRVIRRDATLWHRFIIRERSGWKRIQIVKIRLQNTSFGIKDLVVERCNSWEGQFLALQSSSLLQQVQSLRIAVPVPRAFSIIQSLRSTLVTLNITLTEGISQLVIDSSISHYISLMPVLQHLSIASAAQRVLFRPRLRQTSGSPLVLPLQTLRLLNINEDDLGENTSYNYSSLIKIEVRDCTVEHLSIMLQGNASVQEMFVHIQKGALAQYICQTFVVWISFNIVR